MNWILIFILAHHVDIARAESIAEDIAQETASRREAALVLAVMAHESGFRLDVDEGLARGEGRDTCLMQIRTARQDIATDRRTCIREGLRLIRSSLTRCGDLRAYASGSCLGGARESRAMMAVAERL